MVLKDEVAKEFMKQISDARINPYSDEEREQALKNVEDELYQRQHRVYEFKMKDGFQEMDKPVMTKEFIEECKQVAGKYNHEPIVLKGRYAKKIINHTNKKALDRIEKTAREFEENQKRLKQEKMRKLSEFISQNKELCYFVAEQNTKKNNNNVAVIEKNDIWRNETEWDESE